jgi:hypothetical protein
METTLVTAPHLLLPFVGGFMLCALASGLILVGRYSIRRASESEAWPKVEGLVLESTVAAINQGGRQLFRPVVRYRYEVSGERHEGSRIKWAAVVEFRKFSRARAVLDAYRSGSRVVVYYDPKRPGLAVLQPGPAEGLRPVAVIAPVAAIYAMFVIGTVGYALIGS